MTQRSLLSVPLLIFYNLLPIAGVLFWDWSLFTVLLLYWLESGVIGVINMFKIALAQAPVSDGFKINNRPAGPNAKLFVLFFFPFHYGLFWVVHGVFVFVFFGAGFLPGVAPGTLDGFAGFDARGIALVTVAMLVSHMVTFLFVFVGERKYLDISPDRQMSQPYTRVFVLHGVILGGAWIVTQAGTPMAALALLVVLKLSIDLFQHFRSPADRSAERTEPVPQEPVPR